MGFGRICAGTSIVVLLVMVSVACDNGRLTEERALQVFGRGGRGVAETMIGEDPGTTCTLPCRRPGTIRPPVSPGS